MKKEQFQIKVLQIKTIVDSLNNIEFSHNKFQNEKLQ